MLTRRLVFAVPLLSVVVRQAAMAGPAGWKRETGELRFAATGQDAGALARVLQARLGVPVRSVPLDGAALVSALDRGHVEFGLFDHAVLAAAKARMQDRLLTGEAEASARRVAVRAVLPAAMRADLARAVAEAIA